MPAPRSLLRTELSRLLVPSLRALGFAGPSAISGNSTLHEYRRPGGQGTHVIRVHLDKYGRARFSLSFYVEPPGGFEDVHSRGGTVNQGWLLPRRGAAARHWFRADAPLWRRVLGLPGPPATDVVTRCLELLPEVESWWRTQSASDHVAVVAHRFPGRSEESASTRPSSSPGSS